MTTPRLSPSSELGIAGEKIAKSESLSALFSYFTAWSKQDASLKFKDESVIAKPITAQSVIGFLE